MSPAPYKVEPCELPGSMQEPPVAVSKPTLRMRWYNGNTGVVKAQPKNTPHCQPVILVYYYTLHVLFVSYHFLLLHQAANTTHKINSNKTLYNIFKQYSNLAIFSKNRTYRIGVLYRYSSI